VFRSSHFAAPHGAMLLCWASLALCQSSFAQARSTPTSQIALCMVGDSITWAGEGDYWRKYLLDKLPALAFVGTHSGVLGYSHAGEGGNSTRAILKRIVDIPDCPYYSLLIGTNDNNIKDERLIPQHSVATAQRIRAIVDGLLAKPSVRKVFLGSILPCHTENPIRDKANLATNVVLRREALAELPRDKVVWVEYEQPIRATEDWEPMMRLHPTKDGYKLIASILADTIAQALGTQNPSAAPGGGVPVENLWSEDLRRTERPIVAGWYTLSLRLLQVTGGAPAIILRSADLSAGTPLTKQFPIQARTADRRIAINVFTGYEGYGYTRSALTVDTRDCEVTDVLFEKRRPSGKASAYGRGAYVDATTPACPGELLVPAQGASDDQ